MNSFIGRKIDMKKNLRIALAFLLIMATMLSVSCNSLPSGQGTTTTPGTTTPLPGTTEPTPERNLPAQDVKIFSQNVLNSSKQTNIDKYAPEMIATFLQYMPDSIGVQECGKLWAEKFEKEMPQYGRVGVDCKGAEKGHFATYIYYLKDKYRVVDSGTFWLSTTPDVPSKYGPTVDMNRTCTWAVLENKTTGFRYVHFNTHLDRLDDSVNEIQIQMIRNQMLHFYEMGYPVFATGDFNMQPTTRSYTYMLEDARIGDSRILAKKTMNVGTYANFGNIAEADRMFIDHCFFTRENMEIEEYKVLKDVFVSDHSGIFIHAKVKSLPTQREAEYAPSFSNYAQLHIEQSAASSLGVELKFPRAQTKDGMAAYAYCIKATDSEGKVVLDTIVYGSTFTLEPPQSFTISAVLVGGKGECEISVTPISLMGIEGKPLKKTITLDSSAITPIEVGGGDLLDLSVQNGVVVDSSPNGYEISKVGTVTVSENAMHFNGAGNYRTPNIKDQYAKIKDGFAIEVVMKTGSDINADCRYASNHHAGGFAVTSANGFLSFSIHNGSTYVYVQTAIQANTQYHIVGVYDGTYVYLYVNGTLAAVAELGGAMKAPTSDAATYLCFGADADASGNGEGGGGEITLYSVALYSTPLSEGQALYLYQNQ